jgi:hypothetical protein
VTSRILVCTVLLEHVALNVFFFFAVTEPISGTYEAVKRKLPWFAAMADGDIPPKCRRSFHDDEEEEVSQEGQFYIL